MDHLPKTTQTPNSPARRLGFMVPAMLSASLLAAGCNEGALSNDQPEPPPAAGQPPGDSQPPSSGQEPAADRSVTISWEAPTQRADGTPLTDLAGFRILYGPSSEALETTIELDNPGLSRYVVESLTPGTWYFAMTAIDRAGLQSDLSPMLEVSLN